MDSFDDLLAPSRSQLEDNPFADPFSRRSGSPDPWTSPFSQHTNHDVYSRFHEPPTPTSPTAASTDASEHESEREENKPSDLSADISSDPLDSANLPSDDEDEDNEPLGKRRSATGPISPSSPGFRESVPPATFSEIATIRPTAPEETIPAPGHENDASSTPRKAETPPQSTHAHTKSMSRSSMSRADSGPLTQPVTHSFANLALGGESIGGGNSGGWQVEQEPWTNDRSFSRTTTEDDSDDDKPISQIVQKSADASAATSPKEHPPPRDELPPTFVISVDDPQKVGDPIRSFTMYTVHTRTTSTAFQKSAFSVLRRYSDFRWLYETLSINNPGVVVPPVPEKNTFGRFDDQFVRQRRMALEKCIQKIANHPVLGRDPDLKLFLESDTFSLDIKHRKAEIANEKGGIIASIGQTLTGPRFYESDEWFDRQKAYLDSLESQLRGLVKAIELVAKQRQELSIATGEFAQTVGDLSASDVGKQLAQSLAGLADVERKAQDLQSTQSEQDMVTLMSTVDEYARMINSVRLAFSSRIRTYHAWKNADSDLARARQTHERNRAQGKIPHDRIGYSLTQIAEGERRALDAKHEFEHVSKLIKSEMARFEEERIQDFKDSLHAFLEGMISRQKELISAWENYQQLLLKRTGKGGAPTSSAPVAAA